MNLKQTANVEGKDDFLQQDAVSMSEATRACVDYPGIYITAYALCHSAFS